jgi:hypothetical protein
MGEASGGGAARAGRGSEEGSSEWGPQEGSGGGAGRGGVDGAGLGAWWCGEALAVLRARAGAHGLLETPGWAAGDDGVKRLRAGRWAVELVWPGENVCVLNLETGALQLCLPLHSPYKPDAPPLPRTKWTRLPPPYKVDAPPSPVQSGRASLPRTNRLVPTIPTRLQKHRGRGLRRCGAACRVAHPPFACVRGQVAHASRLRALRGGRGSARRPSEPRRRARGAAPRPGATRARAARSTDVGSGLGFGRRLSGAGFRAQAFGRRPLRLSAPLSLVAAECVSLCPRLWPGMRRCASATSMRARR